ncbi:hypothetical protein H0X48_04745 [Candidatus Dependentiae bacterium]|nr:hypothetical protein [Candidatus Dependentiae bacterium]
MVGLNCMVIGATVIVLGAKQIHKSWLLQGLKYKMNTAQEIHGFMSSVSYHLEQVSRLDIDEPGAQNLKSEL